MTVFISGGITVVPDFKERFKEAEKHLRGLGFNAINPAGLQDNVTVGDFTHYDYMNICVALIELTDCVYFLDGWENSDGSRDEYNYACKIGIPTVTQDEERIMGERVWEKYK